MRDMATEEPIHCWQTYTILHMFVQTALRNFAPK